MNKFKSILNSIHARNKSRLRELYIDSNPNNVEDIIFHHLDLRFYFGCVTYRASEKMNLYVEIPEELLKLDKETEDYLPVEDYLLRVLSSPINKLSEENKNINKDAREKAQFEAQTVNETVIARNGLVYVPEKQSFILRLNFSIPLLNALSVNAKNTIKAVAALIALIRNIISGINSADLNKHIALYEKQMEIRVHLKQNNLCAFIADGSVLPRENGTNKPMKGAIPFVSPETMKHTIIFSDGEKISGMAVKKGVTVITGGGYSGKSTMLDAIEMGIYNHIAGDGREYVITDETSVKIYAEDGRPIHNLDMSPFFKYLPGGNITGFSTFHASGSVSQAANIIEAVYFGSKFLLIDEDRSATNFMIRDENMRKIVKKEPIIPFTDKIDELYSSKGVSTVLVIGGSSEYLRYANTTLLMEDYTVSDITESAKSIDFTDSPEKDVGGKWTQQRYLIPTQTSQPFLYFRTVNTERAKKITLDDYEADITMLTSLISDSQLNFLAYAMEKLLTDKNCGRADLKDIIAETSSNMYTQKVANAIMSGAFKAERWFDELRPIDIFFTISRMRGVTVKTKV